MCSQLFISVIDASQKNSLNVSQKQQGVVLVVVLILVLMMSIIGLAAIRGSGMQELMAGNMRDMQLRFQAAEAGARVGESHVNFSVAYEDLPIFGSEAGMLKNMNLNNQVPVSTWGKAVWDVAPALDVPAAVALNLPAQPRYVLEEVIIPATLEAASSRSGLDIASQDVQEEGKVYRISSYYADSGTAAGAFVQSLYKY